MRLAALILTVLCSVQALADAKVRTFKNQRLVYDAWNDMKTSECGREVFERPTRRLPQGMDDANFVANLVHIMVHDAFIPKSDESDISDVWCSHADQILDLGWFEGDCDDYAFTTAMSWLRAGFSEGNIFLVTLRHERRYQLDKFRYPHGHPNFAATTHIAAVLVLDGEWMIADNNYPGLRPLEDLVGDNKDYLPVGMISLSNYGAGKANDTSAGFVRFWVAD